jgi:pimeloyl-ACP methyl ester carboxylesterase/DNA-binding CsgD family transcriptional regulator
VGDLEAVVESLGLTRFPMIGMSQGGAVAITYAVRHPEKVSHLILHGAYARGAQRRAANDRERLEAETLVNLIRLGWGRDNPAFRQVFTNLFIPGGTPQQHQWWNELERLTASPENAARTLEAFHQVDVTELASQLRVPTLVLHASGDARVPFEEGMRLAALIPGARFVPLATDNHVLINSEPAWADFVSEVRGFLGTSAEQGAGGAADEAALTPAEREVLRLVALGLDNAAIARQLEKSEKTVRNQVSSIFDKLGVRTRAEAIVWVRDR